jgi:hypothetical protein
MHTCSQVLTSVRTVVAMNGQERERARYKSVLYEAYEVGVSSGTLTASSLGTLSEDESITDRIVIIVRIHSIHRRVNPCSDIQLLYHTGDTFVCFND